MRMRPARSSQQERLYARVEATRKNCHFDDVARLLEAYGYEQRRQKGSHVVFKRPGRSPITVPKARPVKEHYVDVVLGVIDELEKEELP